MLKAISWLEITVCIAILAFAIWPFSGFCSGRFMGLDCESRAIFSVNMYAPVSTLGLICAVCSLKTKSVVPQFILFLGVLAVLLYWVAHVF